MRRKVIEDIKGKIMWFNYILSFTIFILLFLIILFSYQQWDFITKPLVMGMLSITAVLILRGLFLSHQISKQVVSTMDNYHNNLKCLLNLSFAMTGENHEDALLEKILKYATALVDAKAAYILLIDKNTLFVKSAVGLDSKKVMGVSIPKTEGIGGWAIQSGEYVIVNDIKHDKRFNHAIDRLTGYETNSVLCIPLKVRAKVIGVIELLNKTSGIFTPEDAESIFYFATQAAMTIDVAHFYEDQKNLEIHLTGILLDAIDNTFPEKRGHSVRVAKYALSIAHAISMSEEEQKKLYRACLLHDIGFLRLDPKDILSMDKYKLHPQLAYEILRVIHFYSDIAPIVLQHHECYDGQGYPSRLKGEDIQLESRIIAIAEAFDAMVSKDSYKSFTYDFETAIEKLKDNAGTQFDPQLVGMFVKNISPEYIYSQT
jgi:putative nucleotidyltransferase with HDIG domain